MFGESSPNVAPSLNNLGLVYQAQGKYGSAREVYERALAIREETLGPDHDLVASTLSNLGFLLRYLGDYASARLMLERAISILETSLGPNHPDLQQPLVNLGIMAGDLGDYEVARRCPRCYAKKMVRISEEEMEKYLNEEG